MSDSKQIMVTKSFFCIVWRFTIVLYIKVSNKYKEQYLQLIIKQKTAAMTRCQQQTSEFMLTGQHEDELLR